MAFVVIEKSIDGIPRKMFWNEKKNQQKAKRQYKEYLPDPKKGTIKKQLSQIIETTDGLTQGGAISPSFFNLVLDNEMK